MDFFAVNWRIKMFINDLNCCHEYLDYEEYEQQIRQILYADQDNEIHLYHEESTDDPCALSILVKGRQAVVNYFSEDNEEIFASIGDLVREDDFRWQIGGNDYSVAGYQILSIEKALQCASAFFHTQKKPSCIEWEEL
jgi:hypothetical protein